MSDLFFIALTLVLFVVTVAYTKGCDKLLGGNRD